MSSDKITTNLELSNITKTPVRKSPNSPTGTYFNETFEPEVPVSREVAKPEQKSEKISPPSVVVEKDFDSEGKYLGKAKSIGQNIFRFFNNSRIPDDKSVEQVKNIISRSAKTENIKRASNWLQKNSNRIGKSPILNKLKKGVLSSLKSLQHDKKHDDIEYHKLKIKEIELSKQRKGESKQQFKDRKKSQIESHGNHIDKLKKEVRKEHEELRESEEKHHHEHHDEVKERKDEDHKSNSYLERVTSKLDGQNVDVLIYYCFLCVAIFTITLIIAYGNKEFIDENEKLIKQTRGFFITGIAAIAIFLAILGASIGKDKDILQKLGSIGLLLGVFFTGGFFTYLVLQDDLNVTGDEKLMANIGVAIYVIFFLLATAYVLFAKRSGKLSRIIRICYCLFIVGAFFAVGAATTSFVVRAKLPKNSNEEILFPLSSILFGFGIFGTILVFISFFKSINKALGSGLGKAFNGFEKPLIKIIIFLTFVATIYLTIMLYAFLNSYSLSDYRIDNKMKLKDHEKRNKKKFRDTFVRDTCYAGFSLLIYFILSLAMSFGGTIKERFFSVFLVSFIMYLGCYLTYLRFTGKVEELDSTEKTILTTTLVVFILLFLGSIYYVLFHTRKGKNVLFDDILRFISNIGAIVLFLWEFAMVIAIMIIFAPSSGGDHMHQAGWTAVGISSAVLAISVILTIIEFG